MGKNIPVPGIEPEPAGWEPAILTTRPYRSGTIYQIVDPHNAEHQRKALA